MGGIAGSGSGRQLPERLAAAWPWGPDPIRTLLLDSLWSPMWYWSVTHPRETYGSSPKGATFPAVTS